MYIPKKLFTRAYLYWERSMFLRAFLLRAKGALKSYLKCVKDYGVESTFSVISSERLFIYSFDLFVFKNLKF